jgi:Fe-S cluster assembly iron-binding protein IscA
MVALTNNAAAAIRELTGRRDAPASAGLRVTTEQPIRRLRLALANQPHDGDEVLDTCGARLFLDPDAAQILDGKALDAATDAEGTFRFAVIKRPT